MFRFPSKWFSVLRCCVIDVSVCILPYDAVDSRFLTLFKDELIRDDTNISRESKTSCCTLINALRRWRRTKIQHAHFYSTVIVLKNLLRIPWKLCFEKCFLYERKDFNGQFPAAFQRS